MPLIENSTYAAPRFFKNPHVQTLFAAKVRIVWKQPYKRERIETSDGDFFDVDWVRKGNRRLVIILHGLTGSTKSRYVPAFARVALARGWDCACMNFRGCSGEPNRLFRSYHSGATEDPAQLLDIAGTRDGYKKVAVVGFSLGGNVALKLLGDLGASPPPWLVGGVAFAAPTHLATSARLMALPERRPYMWRFIRVLSVNLKERNRKFPGRVRIPLAEIDQMRTFEEFDNAYTAPAHGFTDAHDYWARASSRPVLPAISVPTLLVNSLDDPFLSSECHPYAEARESEHFTFEPTTHGGHVGWVSFGKGGAFWDELRAMDFLDGIG